MIIIMIIINERMINGFFSIFRSNSDGNGNGDDDDSLSCVSMSWLGIYNNVLTSAFH